MLISLSFLGFLLFLGIGVQAALQDMAPWWEVVRNSLAATQDVEVGCSESFSKVLRHVVVHLLEQVFHHEPSCAGECTGSACKLVHSFILFPRRGGTPME